MNAPRSRAPRAFSSWWLPASAVGAVALLLTLDFLRTGGGEVFLSVAIQHTARVSFVFFLLAFTASSLVERWPNAWTRWQRSNRRYLGVTFAVLHLVHAGFIAAQARATAGGSIDERSVFDLVAGSLGYLFVLAMLVTSTDTTARMIGRRAWTWLHTTGAWVIAIVFFVTYLGRAGQDLAFLPQVVALAIAFVLRIAHQMRPRG